MKTAGFDDLINAPADILGRPIVLAASRTAERAWKVTCVEIMATRSSPYVSEACWMTASRPRQSRSRSMSGQSLRAGERKRSMWIWRRGTSRRIY